MSDPYLAIQFVMKPCDTGPHGFRRVCMVALTCCVITAAGCSRTPKVRPSDRSWMDGSVTIHHAKQDSEFELKVRGKWPGASPDLWIRYQVGLLQEGKPEVNLEQASWELSNFQIAGTDLLYPAEIPLKHFDVSQPYRVVFDYEIWKGQPGEGELLTKQSCLSDPIRYEQGSGK